MADGVRRTLLEVRRNRKQNVWAGRIGALLLGCCLWQLSEWQSGSLNSTSHTSNSAVAQEAAPPILPQKVEAPPAPQRKGLLELRKRAADEESENRPGSRRGPSLFVADRTVLQRLTKAREQIKAEKYAEAVRQLQLVLDHPEDFFYRPDLSRKTTFVGVKAEAQQLLGSLPAAGRASYELQFGAHSRQLLTEASTEALDPQRLGEVARRYFHTKAGYEATDLLGTYYLDRGHPLAAALWFERLGKLPPASGNRNPLLILKTALAWQQADLPEPLLRTLRQLEQLPPGGSVTLAGHMVKLALNGLQPVDWFAQLLGGQPGSKPLASKTLGAGQLPLLAQWPLYRGSSTRNPPDSGSTPSLVTAWQQTLTQWHVLSDTDPVVDEDVDVAANLQSALQNYSEAGIPLLPGMHPLIVNEVVLARAYNHLKAFDLTTGKELWESSEGEKALDVLQAAHFDPQPQENGQPGPVSSLLLQRASEDNTFGTLSSDGEFVFAVEDLLSLGVSEYRGGGFPYRVAAKAYNRLTAHEIRTGKLKWEAGGPRSESGLDLSGYFFLGPPLPLGKQLYCLVEYEDEVRLLVLNPQSGALEWSQTLAQVEPSATISLDPYRRLAGLTPSAADGVLVCPTGAGVVVAVDSTTRTLQWAYRYQEPPPHDPMTPQRMMILQMQRNPASGIVADRWLDAIATIADGHVVLTIRDSDELHCLNLGDGALVWKKPRGEGLFVAGVHQGKVIVVGRHQVEALELASGAAAWPRATPIAPPSGRGLRSGNLYHLPLSTSELATLDLETGRIFVRLKSPDGLPLGNLVGSSDVVLAQRFESLVGYRSAELLQDSLQKELERQPDDAGLLAQRGRLRLSQGNLTAGCTDLRRSLELKADPEVRALLFESLLESLRIDFVGGRATIAEIESLIDLPEQRRRFLREIAEGMQQAGDRHKAFEILLKLAETNPEKGGLERIDALVSVRPDRWLSTRLSSLFAEATEPERAEMEREVRKQLEVAHDSANPDALRGFLNYFGGHPLADEARRGLLEKLQPVGLTLETEDLLRRLQASSNPQQAAYATARLAYLLLETEHPLEAAFAVEELRSRFAEVPCFEGKTGSQLLNEWRDNPKFAEATPIGWPAGVVDVKRNLGTATNNVRFQIQIEGNRAPYFTDFSIALDQKQQGIVGTDGLGRDVWKIGNNMSGAGFTPLGTHGKVKNHLLLLSMGSLVMAVDTLGTPLNRSAKRIWQEDLLDSVPGTPRIGGIAFNQIAVPGGGIRFHWTDQNGQPVGSLGPLGDDAVCLQRGRQLLALEPLTGRPLWQRSAVPLGCELFGDHELLFVVPPQATEAMVLRVGDGSLLGTRRIPLRTQRLATFERFCLLAANEADEVVLELVDLWGEQPVWERRFASGTKFSAVEHDELAAIEPQGRLVIMRQRDGEIQIDSPLELGPNFVEAMVVRSREHYVVFTGTLTPANAQARVAAFGQNNPIIDGQAHGFERATRKKLWNVPVREQGFDLHQPRNLPVLVLASRIQQQILVPNGAGSFRQDYRLQCLDKRSGRMVLDVKEAGVLPQVDLKVEPENKRISISALGANPAVFDLTFTDQPWPTADLPTSEQP